MKKIILFLLLIFLVNITYSYDVKWNNIDNGGGIKSSANYRLRDSIAQTSSIIYSSANYKIYSGFILPPLPSVIIPVPGMTSIPVSTDKTFGEILGSDASVWKYDPATSSYISVPLTDVPEVGKGYFVRMSSDRNIYLEGALATSGCISLNRGWNLIGNPWNYDVLWAETMVGTTCSNCPYSIDYTHINGIVANYAYTWDNVNNTYVLIHPALPGAIRNLEMGKAYWVLSGGDWRISISSNPSAKAKEETYLVSQDNWIIKISAKADNLSDVYNYCGVNEDYNLYKIQDPPRFSENNYLNLYFTSTGVKYSVDFRSPEFEKDKVSWEFEVETDILNKDITITLDTNNLPKNYKVKLVDVSTGEQVMSNEYTYNSGNGGIRKFNLIVEKPIVEITPDKELTLEYTYTYPNPYIGKKTTGIPSSKQKYTSEGITFKYKAEGNIQKVVIEIYNIKGKLIDRFYDYTIDGETTYDFADRLSNGVYIYRITISDGNNKKSKTGKIVILK